MTGRYPDSPKHIFRRGVQHAQLALGKRGQGDGEGGEGMQERSASTQQNKRPSSTRESRGPQKKKGKTNDPTASEDTVSDTLWQRSAQLGRTGAATTSMTAIAYEIDAKIRESEERMKRDILLRIEPLQKTLGHLVSQMTALYETVASVALRTPGRAEPQRQQSEQVSKPEQPPSPHPASPVPASPSASVQGGVAKFYKMEVEICKIKPKIWRQFLIRADLTFEDLHEAIQRALGWNNAHAYDFKDGSPFQRTIAATYLDEFVDDGAKHVEELLLEDYFERNEVCKYLYDFGDNWEHKVTKLETVERESHIERELLGGKKACPIEDSGGIWVYKDTVKIAKGKAGDFDPFLKDRVEEDGWDPDAFDLEAVKTYFDR